ncbi:hypothetical protein ACHAW6_008449 [Cyclotella cf. meneghiniana]
MLKSIVLSLCLGVTLLGGKATAQSASPTPPPTSTYLSAGNSFFLRNPASTLVVTIDGPCVEGTHVVVWTDYRFENQTWKYNNDSTIESLLCPGMVLSIKKSGNNSEADLDPPDGFTCANELELIIAPKDIPNLAGGKQQWASSNGTIQNIGCSDYWASNPRPTYGANPSVMDVYQGLIPTPDGTKLIIYSLNPVENRYNQLWDMHWWAPSSPTNIPTTSPNSPTEIPTKQPTNIPTTSPNSPTEIPIKQPTNIPTTSPTNAPSARPTNMPTNPPTESPTQRPTNVPISSPSESPARRPTESPTKSPTSMLTKSPSNSPTEIPTKQPTNMPTTSPTDAPTARPTNIPTNPPTESPTQRPTNVPISSPSGRPARRPTENPTKSPTSMPTKSPSNSPSENPTHPPTNMPTKAPTDFPTARPTNMPTNPPTEASSPTLSPISFGSVFSFVGVGNPYDAKNKTYSLVEVYLPPNSGPEGCGRWCLQNPNMLVGIVVIQQPVGTQCQCLFGGGGIPVPHPIYSNPGNYSSVGGEGVGPIVGTSSLQNASVYRLNSATGAPVTSSPSMPRKSAKSSKSKSGKSATAA